MRTTNYHYFVNSIRLSNGEYLSIGNGNIIKHNEELNSKWTYENDSGIFIADIVEIDTDKFAYIRWAHVENNGVNTPALFFRVVKVNE